MTSPIAPSRVVLQEAVAANRANGHENLGALSEEHGFLPGAPPLQRFPESHRAWDEIAARLPELYRTLRLRQAFDALPLLSAATADDLPDRYLSRASLVLSVFAHAYYWVETDPPAAVPACIQRPWEEVTRRLDRPRPFLSYGDIFLYNWRLRDASLPDPMRLENLDLLVPVVGNRPEHVFLLAQIEIIAQGTPIVGAVVRAQEAVLRGDAAALRAELLLILERLQHITTCSFLKIDTNPHSRTYVDPIVWAKTVARYAIPITEGVQGPSGTAAPLFQLLDVFFGRAEYGSPLGKDALHFRAWYPKHHRDFLSAVEQVSVRAFVEASGDPCLKGIFRTALDAYIGDKGFLGAHRLKVYGFLETAYKVGRSMTTGGFSGGFKERPWDDVDEALETARNERYEGLAGHCFYATIRRAGATDAAADAGVKHVVLDTARAGIRYEPGDRIGILPENSEELVDRTLRALRATGTEPIRLDGVWRSALRLQRGYEGRADVLSLRTLLLYGRIRPVLRTVAKSLHAITASGALKDLLDSRAEDQWELWDLLEMLAAAGFDPRRLWKAEPWEPESVCKIVPPEVFRMYSISSAMDPAADAADELHLTVGGLEYETVQSATSRAARRRGTASHFISRVTDAPPDGDARIAFRLVRPSRFHLPEDPRRPVVMFAGGAGISPFRGFLQERARQTDGGENWLFFGLRTPGQFYYRQEIERLVRDKRLHVRLVFSGADTVARFDPTAGDGGAFVFEPGARRSIRAALEEDETTRALWDLLRTEAEGGREAYFYVCGRTGFSRSVMDALLNVLRRFAPGPNAAARERHARDIFHRLVADDRYLQDIFTTYAPSSRPGAAAAAPRSHHASEIVRHNNEENGWWVVIGGTVYDLTEFVHLHPGGDAILRENAGLDATKAYQAVQHHLNSEVDAMLGMYEIGTVERLDFRNEWGVAVGPKGLFYVPVEEAFRAWVRFLYFLVEMENALWADFAFLNRATTGGEDPGEMSPLKTQLVVEAHRRFLNNYFVGAFGEELQKLWAITVGLCAPRESVLWLLREIEATGATEDARRVRESDAILKTWSERLLVQDGVAGGDGGSEDAVRRRTLCALAEEQDKRFLAEMKAAIREGVQVFETHQAEAVKVGGARLLECLLGRVPAILRRYYADLAAGLRSLEMPPGG